MLKHLKLCKKKCKQFWFSDIFVVVFILSVINYFTIFIYKYRKKGPQCKYITYIYNTYVLR